VKIALSKKQMIILSIVLVVVLVTILGFYSLTGFFALQPKDLADDDPFLGPANAKVTIVEFSDYACSFCSMAEGTLKQILQNYPTQVRIVYRDFPIHQQAWKAAEASQCANDQGKFWQYHDLLYQKQNYLTVNDLKQYAVTLGLNSVQFDSCLDSGKYSSEVQKDYSDGQAAGVTATPTFFVNGEMIVGAQAYSVFQAAIEKVLSK